MNEKMGVNKLPPLQLERKQRLAENDKMGVNKLPPLSSSGGSS